MALSKANSKYSEKNLASSNVYFVLIKSTSMIIVKYLFLSFNNYFLNIVPFVSVF